MQNVLLRTVAVTDPLARVGLGVQQLAKPLGCHPRHWRPAPNRCRCQTAKHQCSGATYTAVADSLSATPRAGAL